MGKGLEAGPQASGFSEWPGHLQLPLQGGPCSSTQPPHSRQRAEVSGGESQGPWGPGFVSWLHPEKGPQRSPSSHLHFHAHPKAWVGLAGNLLPTPVPDSPILLLQ